MKLHKIINTDGLQAYSIRSPTKLIKTMFPKKHMFILNMGNNYVFGNIDYIPKQFYLMPIIGYIFTYDKSLPSILASNQYASYENISHTFPMGLDQYFINSNTDNVVCDLILQITGTNDIMPLQMFENLIIRCNSQELVSHETKDVEIMAKNIKNNIKKILVNMFKELSTDNVEDWLIRIVNHTPFNDNNMPFKYPDKITNELLKSKTFSIKPNQLTIGYDLRAESYEFESKFVHALELAYESPKRKITLYDSYNGLMTRVIDELNKQKLPFEQLNDHSIELKLGDLWAITPKLKLQITDLI